MVMMVCYSFSITGDIDYGGVDDEPLGFGPGASVGSTACIYITIMEEDILEYDENFTFEITSSDPVEPNMLSGSVLIVNNDGEFDKY